MRRGRAGFASPPASELTNQQILSQDEVDALLPGITRASVLKLAGEADLKVEERLFSVAEAYEAQEAFYTSASAFVMPVVEIDGRPIGDGRPGPLVRRLRELYLATARREAE